MSSKAKDDAAFAEIEQKVLERCQIAMRAFALEAFKAIQHDTRVAKGPYGSPVRTGHFSASHRVALNGVDTSVAAKVTPYPNEDPGLKGRQIPLPPLSDAQSVLAKYKFGDTITISSAVEYAQALEDGKSPKAPGGVFRPSMLWAQSRWQARFSKLKTDVIINVRDIDA